MSETNLAITPSTLAFALVYLLGSICISGGPCLTQWAQKRGYGKLEMFGMVIFTFGGIFWNMGAMNMPALLVAPLLTSVLIMNVLFAKYVNKEVPSWFDVIGSCFLAAYMILLVIGQPGDSKFHCRYITKTCSVTYDIVDECLDHDSQLSWILDDVIKSWQFLTYLGMCGVSITALVSINWYIRFYLARKHSISGIDVDNYRLSFSCIGGVFGGSEDIFILFLNPMFGTAFAGCTDVFFKQWVLYVDLVVVILWFVFQMWWVSRGIVVAGAKLNGSLELIAHQFSTLFGIQIGLQGYKSFDENMFSLPVHVAVGIFVVAIVCGVTGSAILMHGYSVKRQPARQYCITDGGGLHAVKTDPCGLQADSLKTEAGTKRISEYAMADTWQPEKRISEYAMADTWEPEKRISSYEMSDTWQPQEFIEEYPATGEKPAVIGAGSDKNVTAGAEPQDGCVVNLGSKTILWM